MTLATSMASDLATFFTTDDFAVAATWTHSGTAKVVNVIFSNPYRGVSPLTGEVETTAPEVICKASDVVGVTRRDTVAISGTTYYVIGIQPSDDGLTVTLILSRD